MRYRNVSGHLEDLADGRTVDPGAFFEMDDDQRKDNYNRAKMDEGRFIEVSEEAETANQQGPSREDLMARARELNITGRSNMRNDELQTAINHAEAKEGGS